MLWIVVAGDKMPPGKEKLTQAQKTILRDWIEKGAHGADKPALPPVSAITEADRGFWSFLPPRRVLLPAIAQPRIARNPIDVFLLARLEKHGLTLSPEVGRAALLRRVTFDLTGLPPSPDAVRAFLLDDRPGAYERVVDRLLASSAYGERWGRHWLDVAGYADSEGILDADYVRSAAWRYRDWVVRALNGDLPYDRFLQQQIAGDELTGYWSAFERERSLPAEVVDGLEATGFLRCASDTSRPDFVTIKNAAGYYFQTLDDTVKIVASATMGLTVHCAKCHAHKFDPIPQRDYYQMQAIFTGAYRPAQWVPQVERRLLQASAAELSEAKNKMPPSILPSPFCDVNMSSTWPAKRASCSRNAWRNSQPSCAMTFGRPWTRRLRSATRCESTWQANSRRNFGHAGQRWSRHSRGPSPNTRA